MFISRSITVTCVSFLIAYITRWTIVWQHIEIASNSLFQLNKAYYDHITLLSGRTDDSNITATENTSTIVQNNAMNGTIPIMTRTTNNKKPSPLSETIIIHQTRSTTTLRDVCITIDRNESLSSYKNDSSTPLVQLFSSPNKSFEINNGFLRKKFKGQIDKFITTQNATESQWLYFKKEGYYINDDVLWLDDCVDCQNAGHCLNDIVFSIVEHALSFSKFVRASPYGGIKESCNNVCCDMLSTRFGLIKADSIITTNEEENTTIFCFANLTFPKLAFHRHYRRGRTAGSDVALQQLHQQTFNVLPNMTQEPWSANVTTTSTVTEQKHILLLDRTDAQTRRLANASLLVQLLESQYQNVTVHHYHEDNWPILNSTQQAQVFHAYPYIISPHGAQLVNLFHTRIHTKLLEIQCSPRFKRWLMHEQWFADFAPFIGVDFKIYMEEDGCQDEEGNLHPFYSPPWIQMQNFTGLLQAAEEHFGLKKMKR